MLLATLAALALAQPRPTPKPDSVKLFDATVEAERKFLHQWRDAWLDGEQEREPFPPGGRYAIASSNSRTPIVNGYAQQATPERYYVPPGAQRRYAAIHCHPENESFVGVPVRGRIASATSWHGACPGWVTSQTPKLDMAASIDTVLTEKRRTRIRAARRALIARIDSARRVLPANRFLVEQRVRFLVDDGALDSALATARACGQRAATCAALAGYVLARQGRAWDADSAFAAARADMRDGERCAWDDVRELLDDDGRAEYTKLSCAARDSANARFWWVSRPLLLDPANERRVEHYARRVYVELHAALDADERHDWAATHASDALSKLYARYGVPTFVNWGGGWTDMGHNNYLRYHTSPTSAPYSAAVYSTGRNHVVPAWRAIADPFTSRTDDWELAAPHANAWDLWWPNEHFARRAGPLSALPQGQTALLRRAQGALLAVATTTKGATTDSSGAEADAALVVSWHPDSLMQVGRGAPRADGRLVLSGAAGTRPALVGVELPLGGGAVARSRFGLTPPPPLATMREGETAVSEPVLFDAPDDRAAPNDPDAVIAHMLPSTTLTTRRVGVYWESYGLAPTDTVDVEVRVERVGREGEPGVAIRWREPRPDHAIHLLEAPRPIVARSVALDVSRLAGGRYWLVVSVGRPGAEPARARREIKLD